MKELFNILSNVSNFLNEKRFIYLAGAESPKTPNVTPDHTFEDEVINVTPEDLKAAKKRVDAMVKKAEERGKEAKDNVKRNSAERAEGAKAVEKSKDWMKNMVKPDPAAIAKAKEEARNAGPLGVMRKVAEENPVVRNILDPGNAQARLDKRKR